MAVNKVVYDGETLVDLTDTTATEEAVAEGVTFYGADGVQRTGTMPTDVVRYGVQTLTDEQKAQTRSNIGLNNVDNTADADKVVKEAGNLTGLTATIAELNYVDGVTGPIQAQLNKKADDYSIEMYNGTSGNPKPVKFISVDYTSCNSENGVAIKFGMVSGHGNGSSYAFLQDVIIKVTHTGVTTVDNFKYYGAATSTYDGAIRQYGDIFWVHNADTKVVDFYVLMGQYSRVQMTPWKRVTYSTGGSITQYSSATVYSAGTKEWGNNSEFALMSDLAPIQSNVDALKPTITVDATSGAKSLSLSTSNSNTEWRYVYASGIASLTLNDSGTFEATSEAYYTVVFISGSTATTITNTMEAHFTGDDCIDGVFTPVANKTYEVGIWWNGLLWQAVVKGV